MCEGIIGLFGYEFGGKGEWIESNPAKYCEQAHSQFCQWVTEADAAVALMATPAQDEPTQQWKILPPGEGVGAVPTMGVGDGDAFAFGKAGDYDVEEAAEGKA